MRRRRPVALSDLAYRPPESEPPAKQPERIVQHVTRPERLLIVTDGRWLEAYASKSVGVHVCRVPYMGDCPSVEAAALQEQYVDVSLPRPYRPLYYPGGSLMRWQGSIAPQSPAEIRRADAELRYFRTIEAAIKNEQPQRKQARLDDRHWPERPVG